MMDEMNLRKFILFGMVLLLLVAGWLFYRYGRSIWVPIRLKISGKKTVPCLKFRASAGNGLYINGSRRSWRHILIINEMPAIYRISRIGAAFILRPATLNSIMSEKNQSIFEPGAQCLDNRNWFRGLDAQIPMI